MSSDKLVISLSAPDADNVAQIVVTATPSGRPLVPHDGGLAMREGATYRYWVDELDGIVGFEPNELIDPDDQSYRTGRIRPDQAVGRVGIVIRTNTTAFRGDVVVLPATFTQAEQYRCMLDDIAEEATDAILQGFAPASLDLVPAEASSELLYRRFAVLHSRLTSDDFTAAIGRIVHQPHQGWQAETESRPAGAGFPRRAAFGRAVAAPGPRQPWLAGRAAGIPSLPNQLPADRHEVTLDTVPNRFVKHALSHWRGIADQLAGRLGDKDRGLPGPVRRGRDAAVEVIDQLDEILGHPIFRQVSPLESLPANNQVLLKRHGYRNIFRMFALVEIGATLSFDDLNIDDIFSASQRNVATLYELWCYLILTGVVGRVCGAQKTAYAFKAQSDGLSLTLRSGERSKICWPVERQGRRLDVELYFNRQFAAAHGSYEDDRSWTRAMRPDCSIRIRPLNAIPKAAGFDVWIHFDAKYRVDRLTEQLKPSPGIEEDHQAVEHERTESIGQSKREDLLKMHAYRDAIYRTVGAYVLYPGDAPVKVSRYREILPGLGAFPLRPGPGGPEGAGDLERFIEDVIQHVSDQASDDERDRYWTASIHGHAPAPRGHSAASFLDRPPADTHVLLGYVRGAAHREWIERTGMYNVRADDRAGAIDLGSQELSASLVLLYEPDGSGFRFLRLAGAGAWRAADRDDLLHSGYPNPRGRLYLITDLATLADVPGWLNELDVRRLLPPGQRRAVPVAVTWWDVLRCAPR